MFISIEIYPLFINFNLSNKNIIYGTCFLEFLSTNSIQKEHFLVVLLEHCVRLPLRTASPRRRWKWILSSTINRASPLRGVLRSWSNSTSITKSFLINNILFFNFNFPGLRLWRFKNKIILFIETLFQLSFLSSSGNQLFWNNTFNIYQVSSSDN